MSITPAGAAPWLRTAEHTDYGGHVDKVNFQLQSLVNPRTDVGAEAIARLAEDLASVVRTAGFAVVTFTCNDTSPAAPTISFAAQQNSTSLSGYEGDAAPSGLPGAARNGDGDVTFTWASSYTDAYGVSGAVNIVSATANANGAAAVFATAEIVDGQNVRVRVFDDAGAAVQDAVVTLEVWTGQ